MVVSVRLRRFILPALAAAVALPLVGGVLPSRAHWVDPGCQDALLPPFTREVPAPALVGLDEDALLPPHPTMKPFAVDRGNPDLLAPGALRGRRGQAAEERPGVLGLAFDALLPPGSAPRPDLPTHTGSADELLAPSLR